MLVERDSSDGSDFASWINQVDGELKHIASAVFIYHGQNPWPPLSVQNELEKSFGDFMVKFCFARDILQVSSAIGHEVQGQVKEAFQLLSRHLRRANWSFQERKDPDVDESPYRNPEPPRTGRDGTAFIKAFATANIFGVVGYDLRGLKCFQMHHERPISMRDEAALKEANALLVDQARTREVPQNQILRAQALVEREPSWRTVLNIKSDCSMQNTMMSCESREIRTMESEHKWQPRKP
jgi:hypothetical protein